MMVYSVNVKVNGELLVLNPTALDHQCFGLGVGRQGYENRSWLINMKTQHAFGSTDGKEFCCTVQGRQKDRVYGQGDQLKPVMQ